MTVKKMCRNVIECEIAVGKFKGKRVWIPRITLSPSDGDLPFALKRRQLQIRLSYAMTVNKNQNNLSTDVPWFCRGLCSLMVNCTSPYPGANFSAACGFSSLMTQAMQAPPRSRASCSKKVL